MPDPRILTILREELAKPFAPLPEEITDDHELVEDLGAGPIDLVCLFIACEESFGIEISDRDMEGVVTVGELCALVAREVAKE